jgi:hypothetical protein
MTLCHVFDLKLTTKIRETLKFLFYNVAKKILNLKIRIRNCMEIPDPNIINTDPLYRTTSLCVVL